VSSSTENNFTGVSGWTPSGSPTARGGMPVSSVPVPVRPPTVVRERKPALAALALLLIAAGVLASVYLQMQAGNRVGVIELTQQVPQGQQISESDITEIMVAQNSSINYVTWAERGLLVRYTAQTTLVSGTILIGPMLTTTPTSTGNTSTIPVKLTDGQFPPVSQGSVVNAYYVGEPGGVPPGYTVPAPPASATSAAGSSGADDDVSVLLSGSVTIVQLPEDDSSSSDNEVFTVSVPKSAVDALLAASAEGDLVLTAGAGS
jgi:hypothetical protein